MFNLGPMELVVLALVGLIVIGPEKLPGYAKQAAQMLRTLRELATGAREQLRDELGPEFDDLDLRNFNPRTAVQQAVFGENVDFSKYTSRGMMRDFVFGGADGDDPLDGQAPNGHSANGRSPHGSGVSFDKPASRPPTGPERPRPRPRPRPTYGDEVT